MFASLIMAGGLHLRTHVPICQDKVEMGDLLSMTGVIQRHPPRKLPCSSFVAKATHSPPESFRRAVPWGLQAPGVWELGGPFHTLPFRMTWWSASARIVCTEDPVLLTLTAYLVPSQATSRDSVVRHRLWRQKWAPHHLLPLQLTMLWRASL
ncbi:hypothetical protein SEVIR_2G300066v4 [Setaria viridis]